MTRNIIQLHKNDDSHILGYINDRNTRFANLIIFYFVKL